MPNYTSEQITRDANAFAKSKFGAHYLDKLARSKERALDEAMNFELSDSYRAHRATQASTVQAEIDYFKTAQAVASSPSMMRKLRDRALNRKTGDKTDIEIL